MVCIAAVIVLAALDPLSQRFVTVLVFTFDVSIAISASGSPPPGPRGTPGHRREVWGRSYSASCLTNERPTG